LRQAVIGNAGSILAFRIGAEDAPLIADELGIETRSALTDTANFTLWAKLLRHGLPSDPCRIETLPAESATRPRFEAVRNRSRARSARPRSQVEAKIAHFLAGH
jgi:hypothetical protein